MPSPLTTASTPQVSSASRTRSGALLDLLVHVGDVEPRDLADAVEERGGALGLVGVDVDLQRVRVADDEHAVAEALEPRDPRRRLQPLAGDGEVRAVAVGRRVVLRAG